MNKRKERTMNKRKERTMNKRKERTMNKRKERTMNKIAVFLFSLLIFNQPLSAQDGEYITPKGPIALKRGDLSIPLTPDHIHRIFILNNIEQVKSVSFLKLEGRDEISLTVSLTEDAPSVSNNRVRCTIYLYTDRRRIILTGCGNSEFDIKDKTDTSSYPGHFTVSLEDLGLEQYVPKRIEIN